MEVKEIPINKLKPYKYNPRDNTEAIPLVAESIKQFGFRSPIVIDKDNVIICGHTRYAAAKKLQMGKVPCIMADDLTEEQIKAYRLADNKVSEAAKWDKGLLDIELDGIFEIDMEDFGFELPEEMTEEQHQKHKEDTYNACIDMLNLGKANYGTNGRYDIPEIFPVYEIPEITRWIGFNYVMSDKATDEEKAHTGVHFFLDDYQFERVWNEPDKYIPKLEKYGAVLSPDFSPYSDMPKATQIFNHYRKHWCAAYWQDAGITVIPTLRANTLTSCLEWCLEGEPKHSIVAISTMWDSKIEDDSFDFVKEIQEKLHPTKWIVYGKIADDLKDIPAENIIQVDNFTTQRWG